MRVLHTSDWHLGRQFHGQSLEPDHAVILEQVFQAVTEHKPDALIVAGDIFDRASPPAAAVRQLNGFIKRIDNETNIALVLVAGNHDSADRIESMSVMTDERRALIRGPLHSDEQPLILADDAGPVAFFALPFGYEYAARECFKDTSIASPEDVIRKQVDSARANVPNGARLVIVAHTFVAGGTSNESVRPIGRVGGIETVPPDVFQGAHYVALGHLHRPQTAGANHIRYSGSPLAFGFDEADVPKSMTLVDMAADGAVEIELLPFQPLRAVKTIRGKLADLVTPEEVSDDLVQVILTDPNNLIDPMKQIRKVYPNAGPLSYDRKVESHEPVHSLVGQSALNDPNYVIDEFLTYVRGAPQNESEAVLVADALTSLDQEETSQ